MSYTMILENESSFVLAEEYFLDLVSFFLSRLYIFLRQRIYEMCQCLDYFDVDFVTKIEMMKSKRK